MPILEAVALAIVALFVAIRLRFGVEPRAFARRMAILVVASWVAEDSCIRAYGFYAYHPDWSLFVDRVPVAILLIWPIVIHSAWELARHLLREGRWAPLVGGLIVLADASMIEPIAVSAGLWHWTEPGLFGVPPIGVLGWAYYAALCMLFFEREKDLAAIVLAPLGTHLLLLGSWWGLFRWINQPLSPWPFVIVLWAVALALTGWSLRKRARHRVPARDMLSRVPAAIYFFVLLAFFGGDQAPLVAWGLAFAPPYLSLTRLSLASCSFASRTLGGARSSAEKGSSITPSSIQR